MHFVIDEIENRSPVELIAIGIGHDVTPPLPPRRHHRRRRGTGRRDDREARGALRREARRGADALEARRVKRGPLVRIGAGLFGAILLAPRLAATADGPGAAGAAAKVKPGLAPIAIHTETIGQFERLGSATRFGEFAFRGGLVLSSESRFGGLSGFDFRPNGSDFVAIADIGYWFTGRLKRSNGWLAGIADPMWGADAERQGRAARPAPRLDAESMRLLPNGRGAMSASSRATT